MPPIPTKFPGLDSLSNAQLTRLLEDDVSLKYHMKTHEHAAEGVRSLLEDLRIRNVEAARINLNTMKEHDEILAILEVDQSELKLAEAAYSKKLKEQANE